MGYWCFKNLLFLSQSYKDLIEKEFKRYNIFYSKLGVYDFLNFYETERFVNEDYILFFGRIDKYKGVDILIRAYLKSTLPNRNIKLVIAGKGNIDSNNSKSNSLSTFIFNL